MGTFWHSRLVLGVITSQLRQGSAYDGISAYPNGQVRIVVLLPRGRLWMAQNGQSPPLACREPLLADSGVRQPVMRFADVFGSHVEQGPKVDLVGDRTSRLRSRVY